MASYCRRRSKYSRKMFVSRNTFMAIIFLQLVLVLQVVLYEFLLRCTRAEDAVECLMAVLPSALPCRLGLSNKLLGV